jgi:predicted nuclease of predicted toxin-antitoxin system
MKFKLDENLPSSLVESLASLGHEVDTVPEERLAGASDNVVWDACRKEGRFLITQDLDFSDIRKFRPGTHPGLLLVRLQTPGKAALAARVLSVFRAEQVDGWSGCFVVASDRKVRVRRPG